MSQEVDPFYKKPLPLLAVGTGAVIAIGTVLPGAIRSVASGVIHGLGNASEEIIGGVTGPIGDAIGEGAGKLGGAIGNGASKIGGAAEDFLATEGTAKAEVKTSVGDPHPVYGGTLIKLTTDAKGELTIPSKVGVGPFKVTVPNALGGEKAKARRVSYLTIAVDGTRKDPGIVSKIVRPNGDNKDTGAYIKAEINANKLSSHLVDTRKAYKRNKDGTYKKDDHGHFIAVEDESSEAIGKRWANASPFSNPQAGTRLSKFADVITTNMQTDCSEKAKRLLISDKYVPEFIRNAYRITGTRNVDNMPVRFKFIDYGHPGKADDREVLPSQLNIKSPIRYSKDDIETKLKVDKIDTDYYKLTGCKPSKATQAELAQAAVKEAKSASLDTARPAL